MFGTGCRRPGCWFAHPHGAGPPDWEMFPDGFGPKPVAAPVAAATKCPDCRKRFASEASMASHWQAKHGPAARPKLDNVEKALAAEQRAERAAAKAAATAARVAERAESAPARAAARAESAAARAAARAESAALKLYGWPGVLRITAEEYLDWNLSKIRRNRRPRGALNSAACFHYPNHAQMSDPGPNPDRAVMRIADALRVNTQLEQLVLNVAIGSTAITELARVLEEGANTSLQVLSIFYTDFGAESSTAMANMLLRNTTLQELNLDKGSSGPVLARELARALPHNTTLVSLSLEYNELGDEGATHLAAALAHNTTLQYLHFYENNILEEGTLAIGRAFRNSPSLAASGIQIEWHKGVDSMERDLGHYWQQLRLPPLARACNWRNEQVVSFFAHEHQQQQERRLAAAMALHPRLGSASGLRLLDDCLIACVFHQACGRTRQVDNQAAETWTCDFCCVVNPADRASCQLCDEQMPTWKCVRCVQVNSVTRTVCRHCHTPLFEADGLLVSTVWRDEIAFFARFYSAYDAPIGGPEFGRKAAEAARRRHWEQVTSFEYRALAFVKKFEGSCAKTAASDLFQKLHEAFDELGMRDKQEEMLGWACQASANLECSNSWDYGSDSPGDYGYYVGASPQETSTHDFRDGVCTVCFRKVTQKERLEEAARVKAAAKAARLSKVAAKREARKAKKAIKKTKHCL